MPRLQFDLPDRLPFTTEVQIYASHLNWAEHLDNAQLLTLVGEARVRFFRWLGYGGPDVDGASLVVADQLVLYRSEAFHGETLRVAMAAQDFNRCGFDLAWQALETRSAREVARGKLGIVFTDPATRRATSLPAGFRTRVEELCGMPEDALA